MTGYQKAIGVELKAITAVAAGVQSLTDAQFVPTEAKALIFIDFGLDSAGAPPGTEFMVQVSQKDTGNDTWRTLDATRRITGAVAPTAITTDGTEAAGQTLIEIGVNTPALGDSVFFKNATLANSEWVRVVAIAAGVSFTIRDGLTNEQAGPVVIYNKGEHFIIPVDLSAVRRYRVVCNNNYAGVPVSVVWRCAAIITRSTQGVG